MKKIHKKLILDAAMVAAFVALMDTAITGLLWHELLGLAVGAMFITHILLNIKWIKAIGAKLFQPGLKLRQRLMYINAATLMGSVGTIVVTGVMISRELFAFSGSSFLVALHHSSAWASVVLLAVHVALNWQIITGTIKGLLPKPVNKGVQSTRRGFAIVSNLIAVTLVIAGLAFSFNIDLSKKLVEPFTISDTATLSAAVETTSSVSVSSSQSQSNSTGSSTESSSVSSDAVEVSEEGLQDYLSGLFCTACHKNCPLLSPQCGKGVQQYERAVQEYYSQASIEVKIGEDVIQNFYI